jgi:UDP-galactopyranose mutase
MDNKEILIVGAGFAGATCAQMFAESGFHVRVIEKHQHVGGHCYDEVNELGINVHTYGPHIFHTTRQDIWEYVNRFSEFTYYQHRVLSYAEGQLFPFPINRDTLCKVFGVDIPTYEVAEFLQELVKKDFVAEPENFRDAVVSQVGITLYKMFFEKYTRKQWDCDPAELSVEVAKRIPIRENRDDRYFSDQYQGIPTHGYSQLIASMLDHPNIDIDLGMDYFSLKGQEKYRLVIYTGELDQFFDYSEGNLQYRSLKLVFKNFDREFYQQVATVNYPNDYDWTRITEFKHFLGEHSTKTTVCFEYPCNEGEPYYIVSNKQNLELREKYMKKVKHLEDSGSHLFIGRLAEYTYYNMDQVIAQAIEKSKTWIIKNK